MQSELLPAEFEVIWEKAEQISVHTGKFSGECECSASSLSGSEDGAGMSCTSWRQALAGSLAMASSISCKGFTSEKCATDSKLSMTSIWWLCQNLNFPWINLQFSR